MNFHLFWANYYFFFLVQFSHRATILVHDCLKCQIHFLVSSRSQFSFKRRQLLPKLSPVFWLTEMDRDMFETGLRQVWDFHWTVLGDNCVEIYFSTSSIFQEKSEALQLVQGNVHVSKVTKPFGNWMLWICHWQSRPLKTSFGGILRCLATLKKQVAVLTKEK